MLAAQLVARFGAPDAAAARPAAEEEIAFTASPCDHPWGMLAAVSRRHEGGVTREMFRTLSPRVASQSIRPLAFLEATGDDEAEQIDPTTLARGDRM